jgi:hypothetical protein
MNPTYGTPCRCGDTKTWHPECYKDVPIADFLRSGYKPVATVQKHTGSLGDMAIIVWTGEQPPEGTILYARKT